MRIKCEKCQFFSSYNLVSQKCSYFAQLIHSIEMANVLQIMLITFITAMFLSYSFVFPSFYDSNILISTSIHKCRRQQARVEICYQFI